MEEDASGRTAEILVAIHLSKMQPLNHATCRHHYAIPHLHTCQLDALEVVHVDVAGLQVAHEDVLVDPALDGPQPDWVEHAAEQGLAPHDGRDDVVGVRLPQPGLGRGVALDEAGVVARDPEDSVPEAAAPRDRLHSAVRGGGGPSRRAFERRAKRCPLHIKSLPDKHATITHITRSAFIFAAA